MINTTVINYTFFLFSSLLHIDIMVRQSIGLVIMMTIVVAVVAMVTIVVAVVREVVASSENTVVSGSSCSSTDMLNNVAHLSLAVVIGVA